ncbi:MAG: hypothetical protein NTZ82_06090 [Bacteroidetes bacterium]|nr:hypothetical protein [Bacteroidota bacterium]
MTTKHFVPVMVTFILLALGLYGYQQLASSSIFIIASLKVTFLMAVNLMLFMMAIVNFIRINKIDKTNPNAMVRSVILGTLLKMVVFIGAAIIYVKQTNVPVGMVTLLGSMGMYLIYTWLEIKSAIKK